MIELYLQASKNGFAKREIFGAWIYSILGSKYHDLGVGEYFNGSRVKIHNFYVEEKSFNKGEIIKLCFRAINIIENKFLKSLSIDDDIRLGNTYLKIKDIVCIENDIEYDKNIFEIKSPILLRTSKLKYKYEDCKKKPLEELLINNIERKYKEIYKDNLIGLRSIKFIDKKETTVELKIKGEIVICKCYSGYLYIEGTDEVKKFIKEVGIGNRTSYGLGYIE